MLKIATLIFSFLGFAIVSIANPITGNHIDENVKVVINTEKSSLLWEGYKVTGKHNGSVDIHSGELVMANGQLSSGKFVIDMTTISVHDLEGSSRTKLENHLKSDDFFGVATHPKATFTMVEASPAGQAGQYKIEGNLTIKNITKPITFDAHVSEENGMTVATADIKVDRSKFDVRYGSGSFFDNLGDKTIYDEFDIKVRLVGETSTAN